MKCENGPVNEWKREMELSSHLCQSIGWYLAIVFCLFCFSDCKSTEREPHSRAEKLLLVQDDNTPPPTLAVTE